jgi:hypothetical protein
MGYPEIPFLRRLVGKGYYGHHLKIMIFGVGVHYKVLRRGVDSSFPWRSIWQTQSSLTVYSALGKIITIDSLIKYMK